MVREGPSASLISIHDTQEVTQPNSVRARSLACGVKSSLWWEEYHLHTFGPMLPMGPLSPLSPEHLHGTPQQAFSAILSCQGKSKYTSRRENRKTPWGWYQSQSATGSYLMPFPQRLAAAEGSALCIGWEVVGGREKKNQL